VIAKKEFAKLCALEMGKMLKEGIQEGDICAETYDYYADHAGKLLADQPLVILNLSK
jgi:succinate-semialdehyde dehydrogenase / glutarate-semialdehyde dehydrogenase